MMHVFEHSNIGQGGAFAQTTASSDGILFGIFLVCATFISLWLLKLLLTPVHERVVSDLKHPTHLLYLVLFGLGAYGSSNLIFGAFTDHIESGPYRTLLATSLLAFFGTNALHQYLIYRSVVEAEDPLSRHSIRYSPWWVGRPLEGVVRFVVLALLLKVARELGLPGRVMDDKVIPLAIANACLFATFLIWNLLALKNIPATFSDSAIQAGAGTIKTSVRQAALLDIVAVAMWLSIATTVGIGVVILSSFGYAVALLWTRIRGPERWFRLYLVIAVVSFLVYQHWALFSLLLPEQN